MAPAHSGNAHSDAAPSALCGGVLLRTSPFRSQTDSRDWRQDQDARRPDVGVVGAPARSPAGLYHVGTVRGQPAAIAPEQPATRFSPGAPQRQGAADEPAGL